MPRTAFNKLSAKHKAFVKAYLLHFNAIRAYKEAGYAPGSAHPHAYRLVADGGKVATVIEGLMDAAGITDARIVAEVGEIAFGGDVADVSEYLNGRLTMEQLREEGVDTRLIKSASHSPQGNRVEMYDRLAALEKLMKIRGMITEKHEVSQVAEVNVMFDDGTPAERVASAAKVSEQRRKAAEGK